MCLLEMPLLKQFGQYVHSFGKGNFVMAHRPSFYLYLSVHVFLIFPENFGEESRPLSEVVKKQNSIHGHVPYFHSNQIALSSALASFNKIVVLWQKKEAFFVTSIVKKVKVAQSVLSYLSTDLLKI